MSFKSLDDKLHSNIQSSVEELGAVIGAPPRTPVTLRDELVFPSDEDAEEAYKVTSEKLAVSDETAEKK